MVLYLGLAGTSIADRVDTYYKTALGARSPHAGGWFLKTLSPTPRRWVHWAPSMNPSVAEDAMLERFCGGVSEPTRSLLLDPAHPFPFANLEWPPGVRKRHGIAGAKRPRIRVPAVPDSRSTQIGPSGSIGDDPSGFAERRIAGSGGLTSPLRSQQVTAADRESGQIRFPSSSKRVFPREAATVRVLLRGRAVDARWNPRTGPDKERSGTLRVGRHILATLVPVGTMLVVTALAETAVELK